MKDIAGPLSLENLNAQFCSDWLKNEIKRVLKENIELKSLLREAEDWLCTHSKARGLLAKGIGRAWCSDCNNYLRTESEENLADRVSEAVRMPK